MSGRGNRTRRGDFICKKCKSSHFFWKQARFQCSNCYGNKDGNSDGKGSLGVGTALMVGAGAAAVGFLAQGLWNVFGGSTSSEPSAPPPPPPGDNNTTARRRQRDAFREQDVPKEMKCAICLVNPREICMLPCGHVYLCEDCAEEVQTKCPMCQEPIQERMPIYL